VAVKKEREAGSRSEVRRWEGLRTKRGVERRRREKTHSNLQERAPLASDKPPTATLLLKMVKL
jgi:hypothetical protein